MNNSKNKTVWWVLGAVVVLLIIIIAVRANNTAHPDQGTDTTQGTLDDSALEPTEDVTAGSVHAPVSTGTAPATLSYAKALIAYKNARIQFDPMCQATPGNQTWKNGTNVMLDNRSGNTLALHLGTIGNISIKPWGFKIISMSGNPLPATILIDCGTRQNVATVILQK